MSRARFAVALALAALLPLPTWAEEQPALGPEALKLAAAIREEGCVITKANTRKVEKRAKLNMDQQITASTQLVIFGYLIDQGNGDFRLKGLGC